MKYESRVISFTERDVNEALRCFTIKTETQWQFKVEKKKAERLQICYFSPQKVDLHFPPLECGLDLQTLPLTKTVCKGSDQVITKWIRVYITRSKTQ